MDELTTLTVTNAERALLAHALVIVAQMCDVLDKHADAVAALDLWERIAPETVA